jgi:hypothetical protein
MVSLQLPGELTEPLGWIGLVWPQADEDKLREDGQTWISYGAKLRGQAQHATDVAHRVWTQNTGESIEAFEAWWNAAQGPGRNLENAAIAAELIGAGLIVMAGITLALKIAFIVQLTILLVEVGQAIATAFVSFGATTAEIPGFVAATRLICRELISKLIQAIETQIARLFEQAGKLLEKVGVKTLAADAGEVSTKLGQDAAFRGLMRDVERADVHSPADGARFYSGRQPDGSRMRAYAEDQTDGVSSVTLEQTPGGGHFDNMDLYNKATSPVSVGHADQIWYRLSERYAQTAQGDVTAFTHNARPDSVWNRFEYPALVNNPDVGASRIKVVDPFSGS